MERVVDEEIAKLPGGSADYEQARVTVVTVAVADEYAGSLTLPASQWMP